MNERKKKICFLFGAGAEGSGNFDLPTGIDFLNETIFSCKYKTSDKGDKKDKFEAYGEVLKDFFNDSECSEEGKVYFKKTYKYTKHRINSGDQIYRMIGERLVYFIKEDSKKKEIEDNIKKLKLNKNINELKKIINGDIESYSNLKSDFLKELLADYKQEDKFKNLFDIGIAGILDKYFPSLASPKRFPSTYLSIIFNYYWTCYMVIIENLLTSFESQGALCNELSEFFKNKEIDFKKILEDPVRFTKLLYRNFNKIKSLKPNSYYNRIKEKLREESAEIECKGVITTNYYCFPKIVSKNVVYLNGKLSLFEYPETLEVRNLLNDADNPKKSDVEETCQKKLFFPFIFGQSYTKPIVSSYQTEEFHKMYRLLKSSDVLVVLGYNINVDDNHINSFLRQFLLNPAKKLIFVSYNNPNINEESLFEKLGGYEESLKERIVIVHAKKDEQNENTVNQIFEKIKSNCKN